MGLLDVVKGLLGGADQENYEPSMAEITIISTAPATQASESQSQKA
jgi:hypothetical protein